MAGIVIVIVLLVAAVFAAIYFIRLKKGKRAFGAHGTVKMRSSNRIMRKDAMKEAMKTDLLSF